MCHRCTSYLCYMGSIMEETLHLLTDIYAMISEVNAKGVSGVSGVLAPNDLVMYQMLRDLAVPLEARL